MRDRLLLIVLGLGWAVAHGADYHAGPEDYRSLLGQLKAGDRLLLEAGDYPRGLPLRDLQGQPGKPIVIEGPATGPRARFLARPGANTVSLVDVAHVVIRNLELEGRNVPVDAVKAEGHARFAHFVTLEGLRIHNHAASQQNVGISSKCPAFGWVIRGNRISRVGTGLYLGNSNGLAPFVAGLIEGNQVSDTLGYNLQIKHQKARPADLPEADTRHDTVIRHNFFAKVASQPGPGARPNVLLGHVPLAGQGSEDRYLVHGNLFWHNPSESLFQGEGNVALYNNVFVTDGPDAVRIQPHNAVPRTVDIFHNTVLAGRNGITVRVREDNAHAQRVAGNVVFAARPVEGGEQAANVLGAPGEAERFLVHPHGPMERMDPGPRAGRLPSAPLGAALPPLDDATRDFLGRPREDGLPGAYGQPGAAPLKSWMTRQGPEAW